ncbi:MAG: PHB depolymerase family esterase [Nevskia sp.]|nr:PHB depolymerase family esterase [Nevskia sp.]
MTRDDDTPANQLQWGDRTRSYIVHLPPGYVPGTPVPLVVSLHGGGGNAHSNRVQTGFDAEADRSGFIVVHPDGTGERRPLLNALGRGHFHTWNAGSCCGYAMRNDVDDVGFIRAMLAELRRNYSIDPRRIYASGFSNGGMMSYRLACEMSDTFAAIGVVSAAQTAYECRPAQPVSVIHIHGSADQNVTLGGGIGAKALEKVPKPPVMEGVEFWARHNGCGAPETSGEGKVLKTSYRGGRGSCEVEFHLIEGGGHAWPGGEQMLAILDKPSQELAATPLIWQFFAAHPRAA